MKIREQILDFSKKIIGQDVFIIAGGPSLDNFDFSKIENKICIALNKSYKNVIDFVAAIYWTDNDWASSHYDDLMRYKGYKFCSRINATPYIKNNILGFANATVLNKLGDYGFSHDINCVYGNNSGAQILNFVTNLKPHRIFLLGYDMGYSNGKTHYHGGYGLYDASVYRELFIPSINAMAPVITSLGIEVINCNKKSKLDCFKKDDIEKYL